MFEAPRPRKPTAVKLLLHGEVRHAAGQHPPHFAGHEVLDLFDGDAQLNQLLHGQVHAGPLVSMAVDTCFEEAPATLAAAFLEGVGEFCQQIVDLLAMLLDSFGLESDGANDAFGRDVATGVLPLFVEAVYEDSLYTIRCEDAGFRGHNRPFCLLVKELVNEIYPPQRDGYIIA